MLLTPKDSSFDESFLLSGSILKTSKALVLSIIDDIIKYMSETALYMPRDRYPVVTDLDTIILTTNHLGADVICGDAGMDAQHLADVSGHPVIGANRPGTGNKVGFDGSIARKIMEDPDGLTEEWVEAVTPELQRQSPSRVELVGRSAGANLMLHVASLDAVPEAVGVLAIEALRFQPIDTRRGQARYVKYQLCTEGRYKGDAKNIIDSDLMPSDDIRPEEAASIKAMVRRMLVDIRHYQYRWASDYPYQKAHEIAAKIDITAMIILAEDSLAAEPPQSDQLLAQLAAARKDSALQSSLIAKTLPRTTHGSFDDWRLYATTYRKFAALVSKDSAKLS